MKKAKSGAPQSIDQYMAGVPEPARTTLKKMLTSILSSQPTDATETISYRIPAFKRKNILVWFAAFSDHCSLFPTTSVIAEFKDELKGYSTSKGTIHFPLDKPPPIALIKKIVKARVKQDQSKKWR